MKEERSISLREILHIVISQHNVTIFDPHTGFGSNSKFLIDSIVFALEQNGLVRTQTSIPQFDNEEQNHRLNKVYEAVKTSGDLDQEMAFLDIVATLRMQQRIIDMPNVKALLKNESALVDWKDIYRMRLVDKAAKKVCAPGGITDENIQDLMNAVNTEDSGLRY